ncbi:MAG TPA: Crp/Fnr family transcriptional regulator [Methylibium sp.]|nr:Crp/Fnr family transcriptional regulator [Methylibium sp.]
MPTDWLTAFPPLQALDEPQRARLLAAARIEHMACGERAYLEGALARGYVLRIAGTTRVQKTSASGREVVLYRVGPGDTCVLTTSCLLGRKPFPAEGVAESDVTEAVVPPEVFAALMDESAAFRAFVLGNYGDLIGELIMLLDDVMFRRLDIRLAQQLVQAASAAGVVELTHQQLAHELGSAREAVSRLLKEFERKQWIRLGRGRIELADVAALRTLAADGG